jgi:hypothetical protein
MTDATVVDVSMVRKVLISGFAFAAFVGCAAVVGLDALQFGDQGATTGDAGLADASPGDADASRSTYCKERQPIPTLCLDFDEESLFSDWQPVTANGGRLEGVTDLVVSPPKALLMTFPDASVNAGAALAKASTVQFSERFFYTFDVRFDEASPFQYDFGSILVKVGPSNFWTVILVRDGATGRIGIGETLPDGGKPPPFLFANSEIAPQEWTHVEWLIEVPDAGPAKTRVYVGSKQSDEATVSPPAPAETFVQLGDAKASGAPRHVRFDNVTVTIR